MAGRPTEAAGATAAGAGAAAASSSSSEAPGTCVDGAQTPGSSSSCPPPSQSLGRCSTQVLSIECGRSRSMSDIFFCKWVFGPCTHGKPTTIIGSIAFGIQPAVRCKRLVDPHSDQMPPHLLMNSALLAGPWGSTADAPGATRTLLPCFCHQQQAGQQHQQQSDTTTAAAATTSRLPITHCHRICCIKRPLPPPIALGIEPGPTRALGLSAGAESDRRRLSRAGESVRVLVCMHERTDERAGSLYWEASVHGSTDRPTDRPAHDDARACIHRRSDR